MDLDLQKENQLLQEQIKALVQQLKDKENNKNDVSNRNDQSSFFSTFKQNTPRGMSRDQSKRDLQDMGATIKRLNEEKEQLRKTLKNQTDAYNQKIQMREDELIQKEKILRSLQNDYKELQLENIKLKQTPQAPSTTEIKQSQNTLTDNIQQYKVTKVGMVNMPCHVLIISMQIIIRKTIFDNFVIEIETTKDRNIVQLLDITDLVPDRQKDDHFQISYRISGGKQTETFVSADYKQILRTIKYLHQSQPMVSPKKSEVQPSGGLIKSLSSFFIKK